MGAAPQLSIQRLRTEYLVPATRAAPDTLRHRLDPVLAQRVGGAFARSLQPLASDGAVWVLRSVNIDFAMHVDGADDDDLARRWSGELARQVAQAMRLGPDGRNVLRFADRASYLAYFLGELAAGQAWDDAAFAGFAGLKALTRESALRTALLREPEHAMPALLALARRRELLRLLLALGDEGAAQLLSAWDPQPDLPSDDDLLLLLRALLDTPPGGPLRELPAARQLHALVAARAAGALGENGLLAHALARLAELIELWQRHAAALQHAASLAERIERWLAAAPPAVRAWLAQAGGLAAAHRVLEHLQRGTTAASGPTGSAALHSLHAGGLLLLASLDDSGVNGVLQQLARNPADCAALRCLVLAHALGQAAAADDPALYRACGGSANLQPQASLARALRRLRVHAAARAQAAQTLEPAPGSPLVWRQVACGGRRALIAPLNDSVAAPWRAANTLSPRAAPIAMASLAAQADFNALAIHITAPGVRDDWARSLFFAWLAQRVLRHFARRLPGFGDSSVTHLRENFLLRSGSLACPADAPWRATLEAPPLALVLRIAGLGGNTLAPPWLHGQAITLLLEEAC
jgi:hypothetical protein